MAPMMHFRPISKSLRRGLIDGLSAPTLLLQRNQFRRATNIDASLKKAWSDVGKALADADQTERKRSEQKAPASR